MPVSMPIETAEELQRQLHALLESQAALEEFRRKTAEELHQIIQARTRLRALRGADPEGGSLFSVKS